MSFRKFLRSFSTNTQTHKEAEGRRQWLPSVEELEDRRMLATFFVDGAGGSGIGGNDSNNGLTTSSAFVGNCGKPDYL